MSKKTKSLLVFESGVIVKSIIGGFEGMITACVIRFGFVNYEVTYCIDGEPRTTWMREEEFITPFLKNPIGFKTQ
jgi:hypothetical protein